MSATLPAARLLAGPGSPARTGARLTLDGGRIAAVGDGPAEGGTLVMPALANAHDHARVARLSQFDSYDVPLEAWLPYLALIPAVDPWLSSAVAFGRTARGGVGSVMAHYTRVQGLTGFPEEARAVARAARDVGLRVGFAIHCRDRHPLVYGPDEAVLSRLSPAAAATVRDRLLKPYLPAEEQVALVEALGAELDGDGVTVQYGPAGVQWCSDAMLRRIARGSADGGRRVHMHLLETRYQRDWADRTFPQGIVRHLDDIGLLNPRVSFAHCIYLRPDEMELIAERGATIVTNPSSNLIVSSGTAPVGEFVRRGCRVAMGLDGLSFDEDEDALREMRLAYALHKARGFERSLSQADLMRLATANGRFAVTGEDLDVTLAPGAPADLLTLDWDALSAELVETETPPMNLLLARGTMHHVRDLHVAGRPVVVGGKVTGVDLPALEAELLAALRAAYGERADLRAAMPELLAALAGFYHGGPGCC